MKQPISNIILSRLSKIISAKTAIHFPEERWDDLDRKTTFIAKEFGYSDIGEFTSYLESSRLTINQIEIMANHLTIGETYFWRESKIFEALEQKILPQLIREKANKEKRLRIWSAGCSTGEEPYSVAIVLKRLLPDIKDWNITILATDINQQALKKAGEGVFGKWSFRNVPPWLMEKYFHLQQDGKYKILPEIREMVTFKYLNLAEDIFPSPINNTNAMDIIFCRNVLMYFTEDFTKQIVNNFYNSLTDGSWLIVSSAELSHHVFSAFSPVNFPGAIVYQKHSPLFQKSQEIPSLPFSHQYDIVRVTSNPDRLVKEINGVPSEIMNRKEKNSKYDGNLTSDRPFYEKAPDINRQTNINEVNNNLQKNTETSEEKILFIRSLANRGKLKEAKAECKKAIISDKLNAGLHFLFSIILQELGQLDKALASLNTVTYINPDCILAYYNRGNILLLQKDILQAKKSFVNALTLLEKYSDGDIIPDSEGLTAGRLKEIISTTIRLKVL